MRKISRSGEATGTTKTGRARTISIDDETLRIMQEWKKLQFRILGRTDIIFTNPDGNYLYSITPPEMLNSIIKKHNLKRINIHRFRHIHASMLILSNSNKVS